MNDIATAKAHLGRANDVTLPIKERIIERDAAEAIRVQLSLGRSKIGQWPTLVDPDAPAAEKATTSTTSNTTGAGKTKTPKAAKAPAEPKAPLVAGTVFLRNPMQVALYNQVFLPNILNDKGRWTASRPIGHAEAFKIATVKVAANDSMVGITFGKDASKRNYNLNDSTWLQPDVINPFIKIATDAAGHPVTKKELVNSLEDMKKIFGIDAPEDAIAAVAGEQSLTQEALVATDEQLQELIEDEDKVEVDETV